MTPATYNIKSHTSGDTWKGIPLIRIRVNTLPPTIELASVKMQVRKSHNSSVVAEFFSEVGTVEILDSFLWEFKIAEQIVAIEPASYVYDIQTTDIDGNVKTYVKGEWEIMQDVTRP